MGDCLRTHKGVSECESASEVDSHLAKIGMTQKERVLIYQIGSLGDTVISIPALRAIRRHFGSRVHITLMHQDQRNNTLSPADVIDGLGLVNEFISYSVINNNIKVRMIDFGADFCFLELDKILKFYAKKNDMEL